MMVVAAARGLLEPVANGDRRAQLREDIMIRYLFREMNLDVAKMRFYRHAMAAQYVPGDAEGNIFSHHWDESRKELMTVLGFHQPWVDWEARIAAMEAEDLAKDVKLWEDTFGSLEDADIQADNERLADWLRGGGVVEVEGADNDPQWSA